MIHAEGKQLLYKKVARRRDFSREFSNLEVCYKLGRPVAGDVDVLFAVSFGGNNQFGN